MNSFIENTDGTLNAAMVFFKTILAHYLKKLHVFEDVKYETLGIYDNFMDDEQHGWRYRAFLAGTNFEKELTVFYSCLPRFMGVIILLQEMLGHKTSMPSDTDLTASETMAVLAGTEADLFSWVLDGKLSLTFREFEEGHLPVFTKYSVIELYKTLYMVDLVESDRRHRENEMRSIDTLVERDNFSLVAGALAYRRKCLQDMLKEGN
jgi:hypothetical protein